MQSIHFLMNRMMSTKEGQNIVEKTKTSFPELHSTIKEGLKAHNDFMKQQGIEDHNSVNVFNLKNTPKL